ncbi:MAG: hypothetical protein FD155_708 [Bacteroidetes bacterium]|nr:MAG: hypothetical protein FD155_708 [Bacteroidota bacterium]
MKKFTLLTSTVFVLVLFMSLSLRAQSSCEPSNQLASNIGAHSAALSWDGITAPVWVRYYPTGTTNYKYRFANTSNMTNLNNLLSETAYTWEINTFCDGVWTGYGWASNFSTLADVVNCEPVNQTSFDITAHTAKISWEGLTERSRVRYYPSGTTNYKYKNAFDNSEVTLNFLLSETEYIWEISTKCNGFWTAYNWPQTFTTTSSSVICEPSNQLASEITAHSVHLSWEGLTGTTVVRYYPSGTTNYKYRNAYTANNVTLNFLTDETAYTWDIKTFCDGMWTSYDWTQTFTTLIDTVVCEPVNQLSFNITAHSAEISWEGTGPARVRYYPTGTTNYRYRYVPSANSVNLLYLSALTDYTWDLKIVCNGVWTDYGWAQSFTTLENTVVCEPINQIAANITSTTADVSWEGLSGYTWVRYFPTGTQQYKYVFANLTNAASLTFMTPQTEYTWEINTICDGYWTGYISPLTFTTLANSRGLSVETYRLKTIETLPDNENVSLTEVSAFPNPINNQTVITFNTTSTENYTIGLYNLMGSLVYEVVNQANEGLNTLEINMSDYNSGVYFAVIQQGSQINKIKLIKQ